MKIALTAAAALLIAPAGLAATAPYFETFDNFDVNDLTVSGADASIVSVLDGELIIDATGIGETDIFLPVTGLDLVPGSIVSLSFDVRPTGETTDLVDFGFVAFGEADTAGDLDSFYLLLLQEAGGFVGSVPTALVINEVGGDNSADAEGTPSAVSSIEGGANFAAELRVGGLAGAPSIDGSLTVTSGSSTETLTFSDLTPPALGNLFGFNIDGFDGSDGVGVAIDNFSVTSVVPEPASAALLAVGGVTLLARRRRA